MRRKPWVVPARRMPKHAPPEPRKLKPTVWWECPVCRVLVEQEKCGFCGKRKPRAVALQDGTMSGSVQNHAPDLVDAHKHTIAGRKNSTSNPGGGTA